ncbi:E3 ubiquitin/ISG15 ligase TRIM25-like [Scomber scombrus]|uniref:E3 ubiquitin/ISG15 ligase TRIM25-like n=1 Tax=Scomber scombrus TaxID=13677 RepID=A0AAV1PEL1_SCOSC
MAEFMDESQFSLMSLEEELTCSICLSTFDSPVTIPCGHNFCQDCLLASWKDTYSCPQCRTHFATRPELKKNTVLSTVVETFRVRSNKNEVSLSGEVEVKAKKEEAILCDACMEAKASKTCLTCMASYCDEHLRPHLDNPIFRVHQLGEPIGDLMERICSDHHKLMEFYCTDHGRLICSLCFQVHKGCTFISPEEQRNAKESDLRSKLGLLDGKITKNKTVIFQMKDMQNSLKDSGTNRKKALVVEYQHIRDILAREERDALNVVDREVESGQTKLKILMKKFTDNIDSMSKVKENIHSMLGQSQSTAFLKTSLDLPQVVTFEPYTPRINLDSKKVMATLTFATFLKEYLTELCKPPIETRLPIKTGEFVELKWPLGYPTLPSPHSPGQASQPKAAASAAKKKKKEEKDKKPKKPPQPTEGIMGNMNLGRSMENLLEFCEPKPGTVDITSAEKRSELLKYASVLTLDPKTAHKRISLSDGFTKASVSDEHVNYPECPDRFAVCSQVLASKGFSRGRHYWEVRLSSNNFIGIGLAYGSIDRKGPTSRLGRNNQSWCVEWFNVKLSAWYNSSETVLLNSSPKRVGVLLDCEDGTATFYNVADRAYPFHSFVFPFAEAVYPAFWIFSSGSSISLCKLQA